MKTSQNITTPYLKSMVTCLSKVVDDGYSEDFKATLGGLQSISTQKFYSPEQVKVVNFFRFEGFSDPNDNAILYTIETNDGLKGTLIDASGTFSDPLVFKFISDVALNHKKPTIH
jgi:hypothetical protein